MKKIFKNVKLLLFIGFSCIAMMSFYVSSQQYQSEESMRLQKALEKAAVNCYSVEGFYPPDVTYLQEHYGIVIDEDKYHVFYDSMGSNMKPDIEVFRKGG